MSSILTALEKSKKAKTTEAAGSDSISAQARPPSIRARQNKLRLFAMLLAVPVLLVAVVGSLYLYRTSLSSEGTISSRPLQRPVAVAQGTVETTEIVSAQDEQPEQVTVEERPVDQESPAPTTAEEKPGDDLTSLKHTLSALVDRTQEKPAQPEAVVIPERPAKPAPHEASPAPAEGGVTPAEGAPEPVVPETGQPPPSGEDTVTAQPKPPEDSGTEPEPVTTSPTAEAVDEGSPPDDTGTVEPVAAAPKQRPDIVLDGIAAGPAGRCVIIEGQMLEVGDVYGQWEITEIGNGYIRVRGWDRKIHLH